MTLQSTNVRAQGLGSTNRLTDFWSKLSSAGIYGLLRQARVGSRRLFDRDLSRSRQVTKVGCIFCDQRNPTLNRILCENRTFYARYDNFPATRGHVEIVPKRHVESFFDLEKSEVVDAYALISQVRATISADVDPHGYTIGVNEGRAAGRTIDHLHIHLIPRHFGDVDDPRGGIRQVVPTRDPSEWDCERQDNQSEVGTLAPVGPKS